MAGMTDDFEAMVAHLRKHEADPILIVLTEIAGQLSRLNDTLEAVSSADDVPDGTDFIRVQNVP